MLPLGVTYMPNDTDANLKTILDAFDRARETEESRAQQGIAERQEFARNFAAAVQNVIRPAVQPIISTLKARGHQVEVEVSIDNTITIAILPNRERRAATVTGVDRMSQLSFRSVPARRSVSVLGQNIARKFGSAGGPRGEYPLAQLTKEAVEKELMSVIAEIFES